MFSVFLRVGWVRKVVLEGFEFRYVVCLRVCGFRLFGFRFIGW